MKSLGIAISVLLLILHAALPGGASETPQRTVVVLLFDGFAPAVVDAFETPNLDRMRREGAATHHMEPPFPTISLISGATISTGCWPEHHGIVTNLFLDPERGVYDHDPDADWLTGCEHLQQAAERQGVRAAAIGWIGHRSGTRGPQATFVGPDERPCGNALVEPTDLTRADEVVRLLGLPASERPRLLLAYFCGPDGALHFTGMDSEETRKAVAQSDAIIGRVLAALPKDAPATLLVTTDHGMREVSQIVNVKRILGRHGITARTKSTGTTSFVYLDDPTQGDVAAAKLADYDEFDVLRKGALPPYAHLGSGPRVADLILSAHPPYFIEDLDRWPSWAQWLGDWGPDFIWARFSLKASHGYPPDTPGVHGILYAWGSGIAAGRDVAKVRAIDIHPTVAHLLGMEPGKPVDGKTEAALLSPVSTNAVPNP
jgi:alkaline phosphatase D